MSICFYADISVFVPQSIFFFGGENLCQSQWEGHERWHLGISTLGLDQVFASKLDVFIQKAQIYGFWSLKPWFPTAEEFPMLLQQLRIDALHNALVETDIAALRIHLILLARQRYMGGAAQIWVLMVKTQVFSICSIFNRCWLADNYRQYQAWKPWCVWLVTHAF